MLKRTLILFVLALAQAGCTTDEGGTMFQPVTLTSEEREGIEQRKREFLKLEDLKVGDGPVAAWGRKISADIEARYTDGTLAYRGLAYAYAGMNGGVMIHNNLRKSGALEFPWQYGLILELNGIAVGGKRRITIPPGLVCYNGRIEDASKGANPHDTCLLVIGDKSNVSVREEQLIVETALTESCIPVFLFIPVFTTVSFPMSCLRNPSA